MIDVTATLSNLVSISASRKEDRSDCTGRATGFIKVLMQS